MSREARTRHRLKTVAKQVQPWREVHVTNDIRNSAPHMQFVSAIWINHRYEVHCFTVSSSIGGVMHLVVGRHGLLEDINARELQAIKNELFGMDTCAVEIFPPNLEAGSHGKTRHLWVMPKGYVLPFGPWMENSWGEPA